MTEIERAISEIVGSNYGECQCHRETMEMAVSALTEQAERSNGCEYCNGKRPIGSTDGYIEGYWHEGDVGMPSGTTGILEIEITHRDVRHIKINYCPMCGRKLKEDKPCT